MRLVDADGAVNRFEELKPKGSSLDVRYAYGVSVGLEMAKHVTMSELPTVDAVEVVHGRWKEDPSGYGFWICSACGFVSEASAADMLYKFCPVYGARMDGKDGEHETD